MADFPESSNDLASRPKKSGSGPFIALVVIGLLVVGGLVFALIYFLGGKKQFDTEMLAYLPAESNLIASVDLDDLMKNEKFKNIVKSMKTGPGGIDPIEEVNNKLKDTGLTADDFSRAMIGGKMNDGGGATAVLRVKKSFDKAKVAEAFKFKKEEKKDGKTYYANDYDERLYFPTDELIVFANQKHLDTLLAKDPSKIVVSEEMQELAKKMAKGQFWLALSKSAMDERFKEDIDEAKKGRVPYATPGLLDAIKNMKAAAYFLNLDGDTVKLGAALVAGSKEEAEKAETELKKEIAEQKDKNLEKDPLLGKKFAELPKEFKNFVSEVQKTVAVERDGGTLELSANFSMNGLESAVRALFEFQNVQREEHRKLMDQMREPEIQMDRLRNGGGLDELKKATDDAQKKFLEELNKVNPKFELDPKFDLDALDKSLPKPK